MKALDFHSFRSVCRVSWMALTLGFMSPSVHAVDLIEAYQAALAHDAKIRSARAEAQGVQERVAIAQAQLYPSVSFNAARNRNDLESTALNSYTGREVVNQQNYTSYNASLSVRQPLYRPGLIAGLHQAHAQVRESDARLQIQESELVTKLGQAYFDFLLSFEQLELVRAEKKANVSHLDAAKKRNEAGSGTLTDISEAQARMDMTLADELQALQQVEFARQKFFVLTGLKNTDLARLDAENFKPASPIPNDLDEWISKAQANSPELIMLQARLNAAEHEIAKSSAAHKPTLDAVAQWSQTSSDSVTSINQKYENHSIGVQLAVPLYQGGYVNAQVRAAVAFKVAIEEELEAVRRDLNVRVYEAYRGVVEGVQRIYALEQAVRSAEQSTVANQRSFEGGVRTSLDVLDAHKYHIRALRDLTQARLHYLQAKLQLFALAGEDLLQSVVHINSELLATNSTNTLN